MKLDRNIRVQRPLQLGRTRKSPFKRSTLLFLSLSSPVSRCLRADSSPLFFFPFQNPLYRARIIRGRVEAGISSFPFDTRILLAIADIGFKPNSPKLDRFEWSARLELFRIGLEFTFGTWRAGIATDCSGSIHLPAAIGNACTAL